MVSSWNLRLRLRCNVMLLSGAAKQLRATKFWWRKSSASLDDSRRCPHVICDNKLHA